MRFPRLEGLFGKAVDELSAVDLARICVDQALRETSDLEFKSTLYARKSANPKDPERHKRELGKDVAAMANSQGGVIILGITAKDGAAVARSPVALSEDEERRMEQVIAETVFPHPVHRIYRREIESSATGLYVIAVPRSPLRPHAFPGDRSALCYPRRHERTIDYLSESEVADAYRSRFLEARDQVRRVEQVLGEGLVRLAPVPDGEGFWLAMALVPNAAGDLALTIDLHKSAGDWFEKLGMRTILTGHLTGGEYPTVTTRVRRLCFSAGLDEERRPGVFYAELHTDGSGFVARFHPRRREAVLDVDESFLVTWAHSALSILGEHALRTGSAGDAVVRVTPMLPTGPDGTFQAPIPLGRRDGFGFYFSAREN